MVPVPPAEEAIGRLAALAPQRVALVVEAPPTPQAVGHQYLFVAIPFGSIALADPQTSIFSGLARELAIGGINATTPGAGGTSATTPSVTATPLELAISAYDLLFVRRVTGRIRLGVTVTDPTANTPPLTFEVEGESSSFERFGFTPQLSAAFGEALAEAGRGLVTALQSSRRFRYDTGDRSEPSEHAPRLARPRIRRAL